ncbi:MAG: YidC/Oxa1 family membrane protein insertase, partial [Dehalococcoidia bacterium]|nr:YidC/Oxa1 family membrane protein insertase [Dehalococcoidia bacterium]
MGIGDIWNAFFLEPMLNALLVLYSVLGQNFALSIVAFTIIVRTLMLPLTLKQLNASKAMARLQPEMEALRRKYPGKEQREELSRATMELYQKNGVNPLGCAVPTLIQFPIWIGLYWSITLAMADRPDSLYELGKHVYAAIPVIPDLIPLNNSFLWLNLARPDPWYVLAVLV